MAPSPPEAFASRTVVILVADLEGFARAFRTRSDEDMARFLDRWYRLADDAVADAGGRIVKFMGDAILARFDAADAPAAVRTAVGLRRAAETAGGESGLPVRVGVNVHAGPAVEAELGRGPGRRLDLVGSAVNQTFLLGRGAGIRLSERVYRSLPSGERSPWTRHKPPAVYVLEGDRGLGG